MGRFDQKRGFTILEVVLVLAIAGLIFLMVFIALPAVQRNQRDAQRREQIATFLDALKKFQTNNRGSLPTGTDVTVSGESVMTGTQGGANAASWAGFYRDYMNKSFVDPSGDYYNLSITTCDNGADTECNNGVLTDLYNSSGSYKYENHNIVVVVKATCSGEKAVGTLNPRKAAALYKLEGAGIYCSNT